MIRAIAIDDEPLALDIISKYCEIVAEIELIEVFTSPLNAIKFLKDNKIDLIFLDIQMPELQGFDMINIIGKSTQVILTTAYDEFAVKSYEFGVLDYLLKPIPFPRFYDAISKYKSIVKNPDNTSNDIIYVNLGYEYLSIRLETIDYIQGQGDYVEIFFDNKKILTRENLKVLEKQYKPLLRIHKSFIVNIDKIIRIKSNSVKLLSGKELPIGRQYKNSIKSYIKDKSIG